MDCIGESPRIDEKLGIARTCAIVTLIAMSRASDRLISLVLQLSSYFPHG
jgi:hypothetical protein